MDVASSQRLSGHPTSRDPCLGGSGSRNSSPPQPRPGPLRLSATGLYSRTQVFVWPKGATASRPRSSPGTGI